MINHKNLEKIKTLADRIEYIVTDVKKEARISQIDEGFAWDTYKEYVQELYGIIEKDIIAIYNSNSRNYCNIFDRKQISNSIDLSRVKGLTKKESEAIDQVIIEDTICSDNNNYLWIDWIDTPDEKTQEVIIKKIKKSIVVDTVTARGYSQGDWEEYSIVSYSDISKDNTQTLNTLLKNLEYLFTVTEHHVSLMDIETRKYTSGVEETEEVEKDSFSVVSYSGDFESEEDLIVKGYEIIYK